MNHEAAEKFTTFYYKGSPLLSVLSHTIPLDAVQYESRLLSLFWNSLIRPTSSEISFTAKIHFSVTLLRMAWLWQCRPNLQLTPGIPWEASYGSKLRNLRAAEWLRLRSFGRQKFHHSPYRATRKLRARYKRVTAFCTSHQNWILGRPHFNGISWYNRTGAWRFVWMRRRNNSRCRTGWCHCDIYLTRWRGRWHSAVVCCARSCSIFCFIYSCLDTGQLGTGAFLVMSPHITWLTET